MHESAENLSGTSEQDVNGATPAVDTPPLETEPPPVSTTKVEEPTDNPPVDKPTEKQPELHAEKERSRIRKYADGSYWDILNRIVGSHNITNLTSVHYEQAKSGESQQNIDMFVGFAQLESPGPTYKSLAEIDVIGFSGRLQAERILLLSCYDEDIALSVAKSIAYQINSPNKELITLDSTDEGRYNFRGLIESLGRPREARRPSSNGPVAICVWDADGISDDDIASGILDSLLSRVTRVESYKHSLINSGLCLICLVSPQRVQQYDDVGNGRLRSLEIDFLTPLLEQSGLEEYETLAETIRQQRQQGKWSENDADFYKEIRKHLRNRDLLMAVQQKGTVLDHVPDESSVENLFDRQDPITDTVLYCATYFRDLSPQDFSWMVELFLGEKTEDITRQGRWRRLSSQNDVTEITEAVPLLNRWRRDADMILRRCKLVTVKNENGRRIIDFQEDGLRRRLNQYIHNNHYFFYEWNFAFLRQQGLFLSPKKGIAEAARQLLVELAIQYAPNEVAGWLYEVVEEFEGLVQGGLELRKVTPRFQFLPDLNVKVARRYVAHGLARVLTRIEKENELHEAMRLFWQKVLQTQHQWFVDLLRRMGDSAPAETLKWLKQVIDQGTEEIRDQARAYLLVYLMHRELSIYPALRELMQWPTSSPSGRIAREVLIVYCLQANKQIKQQDYGQWPNPHPLFGFQNRSEAEECLDLLVGWILTAASEVDVDNATDIIANLFAGWYFILTAPSTTDSSEVHRDADLSSLIVRDLLFECLARHSPRAQRNTLTAIWDRRRNDLMDTVVELDEFINGIMRIAPNVEFISDAATARRKLLETRTSLSELRKVFIISAAKTA